VHLKFFFDLISMIPGLDLFRLLVFEFVLYRAGHGQKNVIFLVPPIMSYCFLYCFVLLFS